MSLSQVWVLSLKRGSSFFSYVKGILWVFDVASETSALTRKDLTSCLQCGVTSSRLPSSFCLSFRIVNCTVVVIPLLSKGLRLDRVLKYYVGIRQRQIVYGLLLSKSDKRLMEVVKRNRPL